MNETIKAETVKEWVLSRGIDLVGIARAENLILSYPPRPATKLMPTAKKCDRHGRGPHPRVALCTGHHALDAQ
jgi:hypothetical protein